MYFQPYIYICISLHGELAVLVKRCYAQTDRQTDRQSETLGRPILSYGAVHILACEIFTSIAGLNFTSSQKRRRTKSPIFPKRYVSELK